MTRQFSSEHADTDSLDQAHPGSPPWLSSLGSTQEGLSVWNPDLEEDEQEQ